MAGAKPEDQPSLAEASRSVSIQLTNSSSSILTNPQVYNFSGYCDSLLQPTVGAGVTETCAFVNTKRVFRGAVGVMTYDITADQGKKADKRLAIMFSVPFDYSIYENWFAFGLFDTDQACDDSLYKLMYYENGSFKRGKASSSEISFTAERYTLKGKMSPSAKAQMKIELIDIY
ncbi:hypothetical protein GJAV_G00072150 [Gymnothorax javanicus]|nr:hypothetical protein GJAV_G00072150 [Gymnothorax javanicus]